MIAVDIRNPVEVKAAGIRALNKELGVDVAEVFIKQYFGGHGDYTNERSNAPDWSDDEFYAVMEAGKTEAVATGVWE